MDRVYESPQRKITMFVTPMNNQTLPVWEYALILGCNSSQEPPCKKVILFLLGVTTNATAIRIKLKTVHNAND